MRRLARALLYGGIALAVLGLARLHAGVVADPTYDFTGTARFAWSLAYVALLAVTAYGVGLPDLPRGARSIVGSAFAAAGAAAIGISLVQLVAGDALLPRFVVFGSAALLVPWYVVCAAVAAGGRARAEERDRVVLVGDPADAEALAEELDRSPERPAQLVAVVPPAEATTDAPRVRPLVERVVAESASVVVLDRRAQADDAIVRQAAALHEAGVRLRTLSLFYEEWLGKLPIAELERVSLMFDIGEVHRLRYGRLKRLFDVAVGAVGTLVFFLSVLFVALTDLGFNRGPLFYRQERVGRHGRRFRILKFRTMHPTPEGTLDDEWTTEDDPRITSFGRVMRVTHVDELPQMLNILRGDLSLVGPRPEQPRYVATLTADLPFYDLRHLVRPGLTGWAQVKHGYAGDEKDALQKLQYEFFYLRRQGLALDLRIVGRTIRSVLRREGR